MVCKKVQENIIRELIIVTNKQMHFIWVVESTVILAFFIYSKPRNMAVHNFGGLDWISDIHMPVYTLK